ncbi:MAG: plasmid pRiA4b ORF-3 family protein [Actinobacteria bacterium]|nr:plasmid pRiA4b ORF-3 family protein [Actinomycetota bacterium]
MSPANRDRLGQQNNPSSKGARRVDLTAVPDAPEGCDCPGCSGEDVDPAQMIGELLAGVAALAEYEDALEAELAGAAFVAPLVEVAGDEAVTDFVRVFIPQVTAEPSGVALALLLAIGSAASGVQEQLAEGASVAAEQMVAMGIPTPRWAGELAEPVRVGDCLRLYDTQETTSVLVAPFRRATRGHAFLVVVDEQDCGAAADILLVDTDGLPTALDNIRKAGRANGLDIRTETPDPAELRWHVEEALDARAVHDQERLVGETDPADEDDDDAPPHEVLALLLRSRMTALPAARRPTDGRGHAHADRSAATILDMLVDLVGGGGAAGALFGGGPAALRFGRAAPAPLPAKRKKPAGPAPIYQIKVGLRGAKPPIWRRLLVPADLGLDRLHDTIQSAFGWGGGHLHVFDTPYGEFGRPDLELELAHQDEALVTLEQVVARVKDKIRYTYDFGDDWVHDIVVEKVLDRDPAVVYPRCAGGRRAAPPEDCGGIWGYEELVEALADPQHPEHAERLEWLGLHDATQFNPAGFHVDEVNQALSFLR